MEKHCRYITLRFWCTSLTLICYHHTTEGGQCGWLSIGSPCCSLTPHKLQHYYKVSFYPNCGYLWDLERNTGQQMASWSDIPIVSLWHTGLLQRCNWFSGIYYLNCFCWKTCWLECPRGCFHWRIGELDAPSQLERELSSSIIFCFLSVSFSASTWVCPLRMMLLSHRTCAISA